jgi:hypothetical protein
MNKADRGYRAPEVAKGREGAPEHCALLGGHGGQGFGHNIIVTIMYEGGSR